MPSRTRRMTSCLVGTEDRRWRVRAPRHDAHRVDIGAPVEGWPGVLAGTHVGEFAFDGSCRRADARSAFGDAEVRRSFTSPEKLMRMLWGETSRWTISSGLP